MDAVTGKMVWGHVAGCYRLVNPGGTWVYDPATYEWSAPQLRIAGGWFHLERHKTCMVPTPRGIAVWGCKRTGSGGQSGLWLADLTAKVYRPVAATASLTIFANFSQLGHPGPITCIFICFLRYLQFY